MKHEQRLLDRREFTAEAALTALAGVVITVGGCGGGGYGNPSSPGAPPAAPAGSSDESGTISGNHGHSAVVTGAQLVAGSAVQLDIRGSADHTHLVTLSAAAIQAIQAGQPALTDSTGTDGHLHTVTFNGESPEAPERY